MQMGNTAFIWAAMKAHSDTADLLLKHGAQVNFQNKVMWGEGWQGESEGEGHTGARAGRVGMCVIGVCVTCYALGSSVEECRHRLRILYVIYIYYIIYYNIMYMQIYYI